MRGFRSTFILLAVLAALLGYIYFYMKPGEPAPAEQKAKVFSAAAETIEEISVRASAGDTTTLAKHDGAWRVTAPVQAPADETEASGLVTNLASLELQRVVDENPTDLKQYGLDPAKVDVTFKVKGGTGEFRLQLGDTTATGGDMYARLPNEKRVFLISSFLQTTFDRTTFDLRDKTILQFERDKATRVEVASKEGLLAFAKTADQWRIEKPIAARGETLAIDGLVGRLGTSLMKALTTGEATPEQLKSFGLDTPAITATVTAGSASAVLTVGAQVPGSDTFYAKDAARPMVFTVERSFVDDLRKNADTYRPKDVFDFRPFMANRVDIVKDGTTMVLKKSTDKDGKDTWTRDEAPTPIDQTKIDTALASLSGLQVQSYVDAGTKTGADRPALTIVVTFGDPRKEDRLVFSRVGPDVFATRAGEPGAARVEAARFDEALAAIDALK